MFIGHRLRKRPKPLCMAAARARARARAWGWSGHTPAVGKSSATRSVMASESQVVKPSASMSSGTLATGLSWPAAVLKREPAWKESKRSRRSSKGMPSWRSSTQGRIDQDE